MHINPDGGTASGTDAVKELGRITSEREKYKRLLLFVFVVLWIIAVAIPIFAPPDRTNVSLIASGVLIILSFGIIGSKSFVFKALGISIEAGELKNDDTRIKLNDSNNDMSLSDSNEVQQ